MVRLTSTKTSEFSKEGELDEAISKTKELSSKSIDSIRAFGVRVSSKRYNKGLEIPRIGIT